MLSINTLKASLLPWLLMIACMTFIVVKIARRLVKMLLQEFKDFFGETSIHGLSHILNEQTSTLRLFWFAIFIGSLCYAGQQLTLSFKGMP